MAHNMADNLIQKGCSNDEINAQVGDYLNAVKVAIEKREIYLQEQEERKKQQEWAGANQEQEKKRWEGSKPQIRKEIDEFNF